MSSSLRWLPLHRQQFHGQPSRLHTTGGVDAGTDFEDDVVDTDVFGVQTGEINHREQSLARIFVELSEPEMRQDAVLPRHANQVGSDTHHQQVQVGTDFFKRNLVGLGIRLNKLESHPATTEVVIGIVATFSLGIQYGHGRNGPSVAQEILQMIQG